MSDIPVGPKTGWPIVVRTEEAAATTESTRTTKKKLRPRKHPRQKRPTNRNSPT